MHLSDTLVFGPLGPLLPQPVRVRLVALLVGLVGGLGILTLAGLVLVLGPAALPASARAVVPGWASPAEPEETTRQILVSSNPAVATVLIGGRELGRTPATVSTFPGLILTPANRVGHRHLRDRHGRFRDRRCAASSGSKPRRLDKLGWSPCHCLRHRRSSPSGRHGPVD
jgi:PEGA domain